MLNHYISFFFDRKINFMLEYSFVEISDDSFTDEVEKFIRFYINNTCTICNEHYTRVQIFNNEKLNLEDEFYSNANNLLNYALDNNNVKELEVISYILLSFQHTIENHKTKNIDNDKIIKDKFYKFFNQRGFYKNGKVYDMALKFTSSLLDFILSENQELSHTLYGEIFHCLNILKNRFNVDVKSNVSRLVKLGKIKFLEELITFDEQIELHKSYYFKADFNSIFVDFGTNIKLIKILYNKSLISQEDENKIISKAVSRKEEIKNNKGLYMSGIDDIKNILMHLDLLKDIKEANYLFKDQVKGLIVEFEQIKRDNINELNSEKLLNYTMNFKIKYAELDSIYKQCNEKLDLFIMNIISIDYNEIINYYVENSNSIIFSGIYSHVTFDKENYFIIEKEKYYEKNHITNYLQNELNEKTGIPSKNINRIIFIACESNYIVFNSVIDFVKTKFNYSLSELVNMLGINFPFSNKSTFNNHLIFILTMINGIEFYLCKIYNYLFKKNEKIYNDEYICDIFKYVAECEELENKEQILNAIWFVYFMIYSKYGKNIRNIYAHGNVKSGTVDYPSVYIAVSCFLKMNLLSQEVLLNFK